MKGLAFSWLSNWYCHSHTHPAWTFWWVVCWNCRVGWLSVPDRDTAGSRMHFCFIGNVIFWCFSLNSGHLKKCPPHVIKDDPLPIKMDSEQNIKNNKMCKYDEENGWWRDYGDTSWIEDDCHDTFSEFIFPFPSCRCSVSWFLIGWQCWNIKCRVKFFIKTAGLVW